MSGPRPRPRALPRLPAPATGALALAACAFAAAALFVQPDLALAHVPVLESLGASDASGTADSPYPDAQPIGAPDESRALYGYLAEDQRFDSYVFDLTQPFSEKIELLVPARAELADFEPTVMLVNSETGERKPVPSAEGETFVEPFSLARFRRVAEGPVELDPGRWVVVVEPGGGSDSGHYVVAFSGAERFTPADWARTLTVLPSIWLGTWGEDRRDRPPSDAVAPCFWASRPPRTWRGGDVGRRPAPSPDAAPYQPSVPGSPLNGPTTSLVIHPP